MWDWVFLAFLRQKNKPQKQHEKVNWSTIAKANKGRNILLKNKFNYLWPYNRIFWIRSNQNQFSCSKGFVNFLASQGYIVKNWPALKDSLKVSLANNVMLPDIIRFEDKVFNCWSRSKVGSAIVIERLPLNLRKLENLGNNV